MATRCALGTPSLGTISIAAGLLLASTACELVPAQPVGGKIPDSVTAVPEKTASKGQLNEMMAMLTGQGPEEEAEAVEEAVVAETPKPRGVRRIRVVEKGSEPVAAVLPELPPEPEAEPEV